MLIRRITELTFRHCRLLTPNALNAHSATCPAGKTPTCPGSGGIKDGAAVTSGVLVRAERSGKCRHGFFPEEWFLFFHSKTGVTGPYILGLVMTNYLISKEIYIMEHEYYSGLSWIPVIYIITTKLGPKLAERLDKQVDEVADGWESERNSDIAFHEEAIKYAKDAQWRANGQKMLMDAKKENIAMQLEAAYRHRSMHVYRSVKDRMDYHLKKSRMEYRLRQRWMISWVIANVRKSITPEFQKLALETSIRELTAAASRMA